MAKTFYVYMLASGPCGYLYVGVTNDLVRRVGEHKLGLVPGHTCERGIDQLVWFETHAYIDQAILREKRIKRWLRNGSSPWSSRTTPGGSIFTARCGPGLGPVRRRRPGRGEGVWPPSRISAALRPG